MPEHRGDGAGLGSDGRCDRDAVHAAHGVRGGGPAVVGRRRGEELFCHGNRRSDSVSGLALALPHEGRVLQTCLSRRVLRAGSGEDGDGVSRVGNRWRRRLVDDRMWIDDQRRGIEGGGSSGPATPTGTASATATRAEVALATVRSPAAAQGPAPHTVPSSEEAAAVVGGHVLGAGEAATAAGGCPPTPAAAVPDPRPRGRVEQQRQRRRARPRGGREGREVVLAVHGWGAGAAPGGWVCAGHGARCRGSTCMGAGLPGTGLHASVGAWLDAAEGVALDGLVGRRLGLVKARGSGCASGWGGLGGAWGTGARGPGGDALGWGCLGGAWMVAAGEERRGARKPSWIPC
jgi:hypothetical protein